MGARAGHELRRVLRRRDRPVAPLRARTSRCSPSSARTPTGCRSSGRGSSRRRASSAPPRSSTTGACSGTLEQHGLTAFVTLHHFTLPRWLAERGGWLAPGRGRALRPLHRARRRGARRPDAVRGHDQRAADRRPHGLPRGLVPARHAQPRALPPRHRAADRGPRGRGRRGQDRARRPAGRRLPAAAGLRARAARRPGVRGGVRRAAPRDGGRLPRRPRGRLGRRAVLHAPARRSGLRRRLRARAGRRAADADGLGDPPRGPAPRDRRAARTGLPVYVTENGIATADDAQRVAYLRVAPGAGGAGAARRRRRARLPLLEQLRQLRVGRGLSPHLRVDRDRSRRRPAADRAPERARLRAIAATGSLEDSSEPEGG